MTRRILRTGMGLVLGLSAVVAAAADDPKPANSQSSIPKPTVGKLSSPDFAGYMSVTKVLGEVVKADDSQVKLRIYWEELVQKKNNGSRGRRPSIGSSRGHHNPFATRRPNVQIKWEHHDYDLPYVTDSLVRTRTLPPKLDPNGKKGFYSDKEQDEMRQPFAAPGYQALKGDLTPGTVVEAYIIRDRTIPASKVTDADMRIKYAVILGHDPNPPKDISSPSKTPPKKKN
jgi:hypothetical protein